MYENYRWASTRYKVDPREIARMKKNMQKIPLIQAQSDAYHAVEEEHADILLYTHLGMNDEQHIVSEKLEHSLDSEDYYPLVWLGKQWHKLLRLLSIRK